MEKRMEVYSSNSIIVEHSVSQDRLLLKCLHTLNSDEFRAGLLQALQYAKEHQIKQWLLDLKEIGRLNEEEETWVQVQLFPQIMMHLGTGNYVAIVVEESCYDHMLHESGLLGLKSYNSFIIINTFCDIQVAMDWLNKKQAKSA